MAKSLNYGLVCLGPETLKADCMVRLPVDAWIPHIHYFALIDLFILIGAVMYIGGYGWQLWIFFLALCALVFVRWPLW